MAQTSRFDTFGLVCLAAAALAHPALIMSGLRCKIIVSDEEKIRRIKEIRTCGPNASKRLVWVHLPQAHCRRLCTSRARYGPRWPCCNLKEC